MFAKSGFRNVLPRLARPASTQAKSLQAILQKNPDDVVISFAARTAMGRVRKGQLKDAPVDEILHALFKVLGLLCSMLYECAANITL